MSPDYWAGNSRKYIARHESGHAAGYWSQGIPLAYVTIVGHGSQPRPHTQPVDPAQVGYGQKILAYASGVIAGFQYNRQRLSDAGIAELLVGSADDQFEIVGLVSGARTRLPRAPLVGPGEDLEPISPKRPSSLLRPAMPSPSGEIARDSSCRLPPRSMRSRNVWPAPATSEAARWPHWLWRG